MKANTDQAKTLPRYTPPKAIRLGEKNIATGQCRPGSSDITKCTDGSFTPGWCGVGDTADAGCLSPGSFPG